jgi:hypothetical protein
LAAPSQLGVEILGAHEAVGLLEHGRQRSFLGGRPRSTRLRPTRDRAGHQLTVRAPSVPTAQQ